MAAIGEQSWESFSAPWHVDVRIAFEVGRAALARPLRPGSTVVILSSGAALGGSPLSGGYAGAKRTQMFLAGYLQRAADARGLGIRFVALVPGQLLTGTAIGRAAAAAYGAETGQSADAYLKERFPAPLDAAGVARTILGIVSGEEYGTETALVVTGKGVEPV
jgi:NAD(P)-dependent dehydrogenase (short-subunit alcohol dehydrogenase family)